MNSGENTFVTRTRPGYESQRGWHVVTSLRVRVDKTKRLRSGGVGADGPHARHGQKVRTGIRTPNLSLRRRTPYPLGHTEFLFRFLSFLLFDYNKGGL